MSGCSQAVAPSAELFFMDRACSWRGIARDRTICWYSWTVLWIVIFPKTGSATRLYDLELETGSWSTIVYEEGFWGQ